MPTEQRRSVRIEARIAPDALAVLNRAAEIGVGRARLAPRDWMPRSERVLPER